MALKRATKRDARLRFAFIGPAGSGKTRSALELAIRIGKKIAVIDSERGRSRAYSDLFEFDVEDELPDFSPANYTKAIKECERHGYDVIVVDSGSHEWAGAGGVLAIVDGVAARSGNKFTAWATGTPAHNLFIDSLLQCKAHLIVTFRAKTEWVLEDVNGKKIPKAVGMGAVARDGTEYEWDFCGLMDLDHNLTMIKTTNAADLEGKRYHKPAADLAADITRWLSENTNPSPASAPASPVATPRAAVPATGEEVKNGAAAPVAQERAGAVSETGAKLATAGTNPASPDFAAEIAKAKTQKRLHEIAVEIKRAKVTGAPRDALLAVYEKREHELSQKAAAA